MSGFSVDFLTREGCLLCAEALPLVVAVADDLGIGVNVVDIGADDRLMARYGRRIPVILGPEGDVVAEGAIANRRALRRALRRAGGGLRGWWW